MLGVLEGVFRGYVGAIQGICRGYVRGLDSDTAPPNVLIFCWDHPLLGKFRTERSRLLMGNQVPMHSSCLLKPAHTTGLCHCQYHLWVYMRRPIPY